MQYLFLILFFYINNAYSQTLTYTFIDPCTKEVSLFSVPVTGTGTTLYFHNRQAYFTAADVSNGNLANWINSVYNEYRQNSPCGLRSTQLIQNNLTSQFIGSSIQSVISSLLIQVDNEAKGGSNKKTSSKRPVSSNGTGSGSGSSGSSGVSNEKTEVSSVVLNVDSRQERGAKSGAKRNPIIISSDLKIGRAHV